MADTLLTSWGFDGGTVEGWTASPGSTASSSAAQSRTGGRSLALTANGAGNFGVSSPNYPATPGKRYICEVWCRRTVAGQILQTFLTFIKADGVTHAGTGILNGAQELGQIASAGFGTTNAWQSSKLIAVAPSDAVYVTVTTIAYNMVNGGVYYTDDVTLRREDGLELIGRPLVRHGGGSHRMIENDLLPWSHTIDAGAIPDASTALTGSSVINKTWWFGLLAWTGGLNSFISYDVYTARGVWRMEWFRDKRSDYPIVQYDIDGVNVGDPQDLYAAARTRVVHTFDGIYLDLGWHRFTTKAVSKNAAATTAYTNVFSGLILTRLA